MGTLLIFPPVLSDLTSCPDLLLFLAVAINLIVQHIQDILNGGLNKRQNGYVNGHSTPRQRRASESSSRPH